MGLATELRRLMTVYQPVPGFQPGPDAAPPTRSRAAESTVVPAAPAPPQLQATGVFVTPQSLVSFPVASSVVTIIWQVLGQMDARFAGNAAVALVISLVVGLFIYFITMSPQGTTQEKTAQFGIAVVNSFVLAATALGISETVLPAG